LKQIVCGNVKEFFGEYCRNDGIFAAQSSYQQIIVNGREGKARRRRGHDILVDGVGRDGAASVVQGGPGDREDKLEACCLSEWQKLLLWTIKCKCLFIISEIEVLLS
jgi:hypothetical protein